MSGGSFDKPDSNRAEVVATLRKLGATVSLIRGAKGTPDLLVGFAGVNLLAEVKRPRGPKGGKGGELSDDQATWHALWQGQVVVIRSSEDAIALLLSVRG